ncbi:MAG TPA: hypothetical protein VFD93_01770, partial [Candidatus Acidoferrales bacterium]|nr:hypothetical protein [Candidatus Acidoferrales bacterium]
MDNRAPIVKIHYPVTELRISRNVPPEECVGVKFFGHLKSTARNPQDGLTLSAKGSKSAKSFGGGETDDTQNWPFDLPAADSLGVLAIG